MWRVDQLDGLLVLVDELAIAGVEDEADDDVP